ncbi:DUF305 domain-containing protein [Planomonospora venezuelensis]|uniref:Uncharacterized protein (DUF305 family) n=1 Tax=Planomonospora venezuelensis TaxID=1999 RepID=A0A841D4I2_PLAVE|nr:DUF305 domain-containing protein [Planomonospora venezuelensis]MBB5965552.1 uncharacterized protein (DUF305 family) [Planomonospora venezuelensis]GIN02613.1 lipoprotein [Planomonospora venezuelensis]
MFTDRSTVRRIALTAAAGAGALTLLAACGGGDRPAADGGPTASVQPSASFNDTDVAFAQMMIPHHRQAVEMAELAGTRAADAEVKALAAKIKAAQDPEIATMTGWLAAWGRPVEPGEGHGGHGVAGMTSEDDMAALEQARGAAFDRMFTELMTAHHQGAIEMARTEQARGASPEARQLAKTIELAQQAEVDQMSQLIDRL